jgi:hypothetical protein
MIFDITNILSDGTMNSYHFNPSLICVDNDNHLYLGTYRYIKYNVEEKVHPWKMWTNGAAYFKKKYPELFKANEALMVNNKLYTLEKYRALSDPDTVVKLDTVDPDLKKFLDELFSYDGTSIFLMDLTDLTSPKIICNKRLIFKNMIQDARLNIVNDQIILSYNGFIQQADKMHVVMFYRQIFLKINRNTIYIGSEKSMLGDHARQVEKNCVFGPDKSVLYSIGKAFKIIDHTTNKMIIKSIPTIKDVINYYGEHNLYFSLGTPVVEYEDKFLTFGHTKIDWHRETRSDPFGEFMKSIDFSKVKKHGKYIYFMFAMVFDSDYNVISMSPQFIPTDGESHLPYLLVFPTGLTKHNNKFLITYGEGDERSKILTMTKSDIDSILIPVNDIRVLSYKFSFYRTDLNKLIPEINNVLILGYYYRFNTGDDGFKVVFDHYLKNKTLTYCEASTFDISKIHDYSLVIAGGGDIITPYFMEMVKKIKATKNIRVIGISVGIPYLDCIHYCEHLDEIYLRNFHDVPKVRELFPNKKVEYYPDLCFSLNKVYKTLRVHPISSDHFNIGVYLARTYYHKDYEAEYFNFISDLADLLERTASLTVSGKPVKLHFIPLGVNKSNTKENDYLINSHVSKLINRDVVLHVIKKDNVYDVFSLMQTMNYNICSRFHSHIFSLVHRTPFTSISSTRKCSELMYNFKLESNLIEPNKNKLLLPVSLDSNAFEVVLQGINSRDLIKEQIHMSMDGIDAGIDELISVMEGI